jgi:hypothetical protein
MDRYHIYLFFLLWGHIQENLNFNHTAVRTSNLLTFDTPELQKPKVHIIENGKWQGLTNDMIGFRHVRNSFDLAEANVAFVRRKK